jgi:diguanylate cyclase (GGDEF)-like protein/PAS domain S-box-containing protein
MPAMSGRTSESAELDGDASGTRRGWKARLAAALGSLKLRVTLGAVGALALGIGLTSAILLHQAERDTLAAQRERELAAAERGAAALSRHVIGLQRALQSTAARLDPATLADDARLAAFIASQPVLRGMFANLFAVAADGTMRFHTDPAAMRRPAVNVAEREYFRRTVAEQRAVVSEPLHGRLSGDPIVVFTYPLQLDGRVYGMLAGTLRLTGDDLLGEFTSSSDADPSSLLVVTDAHGHVLAHPDRRRLLQLLTTEPRLAQAFDEWQRGGSAIEPAGLHLTQADELVSASGVAAIDWMVWRARPRAELLAPLAAARRQSLVWAFGLIVILSAATLAWLWRLLRPLSALELRAGRLFDADQDPSAGWPQAGGEFGRLGRVLRHVGIERANLEALNAQVLQRLGSVMRAAPVGICFTRQKTFELVSAEFCRLFGYPEQAFVGHPARMIYRSDADYAAVGTQVGKAFGAGQMYVGECQLKRIDGSLFWAQLRGAPVDAGDPLAGTIWTVNDIDAQVAARARLEWSASHDALTGLANRNALDGRLAQLFEDSLRSVPATLVMIDLDDFKPINDTAGHAAGDAVLRAVAHAVTDNVRPSDLAVRLGGDEFAVLLERCSLEIAMTLAEKVREAIAATTVPWQRRVLRVGASVGVAPLTAETPDAATWMGEADRALYRAKAEGRGVVRAVVHAAGARIAASHAADA